MKTTSTAQAVNASAQNNALNNALQEALFSLNSYGAMGFVQHLVALHNDYTQTMHSINQPTLQVDKVWRGLQENAEYYFKTSSDRIFFFSQLIELMGKLDDLDKAYRESQKPQSK